MVKKKILKNNENEDSLVFLYTNKFYENKISFIKYAIIKKYDKRKGNRMKKALPIGIFDYNELQTSGYYVVDKTLMIKDFLEIKAKGTLITRPRRFGKSLNMSMLVEFFDITKDSKDLFKDTQIFETNYASEMNQYPTIFLSFANAKGDKDLIIKALKHEIMKEYHRYLFLFDSLSNRMDKKKYDDLLQNDDIVEALHFLIEMLEKYYSKKVMVFIDDYDTPFIEAHIKGFYEEIKEPLVSLFNELFTSTSSKHVLLMGMQVFEKENLESVNICTVKDHDYDQYFGFTKEETKALLEYYELELNGEVNRMYDGYHLGKDALYNPLSITHYASKQALDTYWLDSLSDTMIKAAIEKHNGSEFKQEFEFLVHYGYIDTNVELEVSFFEEDTMASLWGLLVNAGYLTLVSNERIKIPNHELRKEMTRLVADHLGISRSCIAMMCLNLISKDFESFIKDYQFFYKNLKDKKEYAAMELILCAALSNKYNVVCREGNGLMLLIDKKDNELAYVLVFKYFEDASKDELSRIAQEIVTSLCDSPKNVVIALVHQDKDVVIKVNGPC